LKGGVVFDVDGLISKKKDLEQKLAAPDVWNDREKVTKITREIKRIKNIAEPWIDIRKQFDELSELYQLAIEENEEELEPEIKTGISSLVIRINDLENLSLFTEQNDESNAYMNIHSGAGGTEACDWVSMLLRMYLRWCEKKGFKTEIVDLLPGEEAGIKSVMVYIQGTFVYGYLKNEIGIHRLVRISPFDSNARRHTSFASAFCFPEIDDEIVVDIDPKDLKIDTYRSQGAGGQHVNTTDSAVRITHLPTNIVAQCQNERSQHKNKSMAMKILKSKLYDYLKTKQNEVRDEQEKNKKDISWGNQIRSYVFQPYSLVKDLRTGVEKGNVSAVMDGEIDEFIEAALKNPDSLLTN
jgi:peptide chain release factor 2